MARKKIVVGNWKLHNSIADSLALATSLKNQLSSLRTVEIGIAPVFTALHAVAKRLEDSPILLFAQNSHFAEKGAFTGEVAPSLLKDVGCHGVILGHSERRTLFGESSELIAKKTKAALAAGLRVILCVGETERERDQGQAESVVAEQFSAAFSSVDAAQLPQIVIAYEPVWAIGTGRTATPAQAQEMHKFIRSLLHSRCGEVGKSVQIQYGGSVKPDNAQALLHQDDIDGALVGGASLQANDFTEICRAAAPKSDSK